MGGRDAEPISCHQRGKRATASPCPDCSRGSGLNCARACAGMRRGAIYPNSYPRCPDGYRARHSNPVRIPQSHDIPSICNCSSIHEDSAYDDFSAHGDRNVHAHSYPRPPGLETGLRWLSHSFSGWADTEVGWWAVVESQHRPTDTGLHRGTDDPS